MAFPSSPTDKQIFEDYQYNSSVQAWENIKYQKVPEDGLIVYLPQDGTVYGANYVPGIVGTALSFDGVDDYVEYESINISGGFTFSGWFKSTSSASYQTIINVDGSSTGNPQLRLHQSKVQFRFYASNDITSNDAYSDGEWHLATGGLNDNGNYFLYVDASYQGSATPSDNINWTGYLRSGRYTSYDYYNGLIDDVRVYNRALTEEEIQILYKQGSVDPYYPQI